MNGASMSPPAPPRRRWRSVGAVVAGFVVVFVLSLGTDQVLHVLKVYPRWGEPIAGALYVMATAYRIVYTILGGRSEEHTSELQSRLHLVCRLLLEKKKKIKMTTQAHPQTTFS